VDVVTALVLLLIVGILAWLLPIPGIVVAAAVAVILIALLLSLLRTHRGSI
jgi:hypothetical protein